MTWYLDGWYSDRETAERMRSFYAGEAGASEAHVVINAYSHDSFAVVYKTWKPVAEWHRGDET